MLKSLVICFSLLVMAACNAAGGEPRLADRHAQYGVKCEQCHKQTPPKDQDEIACIQCHNPDKLAEATANLRPTNPHNSPHYQKELECTNCHKGHTPPEDFCAQCHKFNLRVK